MEGLSSTSCPSPSKLASASLPSQESISGYGGEKERGCEPQRTAAAPGERAGARADFFGTHHPDFVSLHQRLNGYYSRAFTGRWRPFAINGAFSVLAGVAALTSPVFLDSGVLTFAGGLLAARGALILVSMLSAPLPGRFATTMLSGFFSLVTGSCLLLNLFSEPESLILLFSGYFISTGIATILFAASCRRQHCAGWEWLLVSGILNLDLALISLSRLPEHFIWTLAIFLGLDLIAHGSALAAVVFGSNGNVDRRAEA